MIFQFSHQHHHFFLAKSQFIPFFPHSHHPFLVLKSSISGYPTMKYFWIPRKAHPSSSSLASFAAPCLEGPPRWSEVAPTIRSLGNRRKSPHFCTNVMGKLGFHVGKTMWFELGTWDKIWDMTNKDGDIRRYMEIYGDWMGQMGAGKPSNFMGIKNWWVIKKMNWWWLPSGKLT